MLSSRDEIRRNYCAAWRKARAGEPLDSGERRIAEVIGEHPEYQALIESGAAAIEAEFPPEAGATNPFLHMGLHIALREQVAIDRPSGIRAVFHTLAARDTPHAAEHIMMECLAEALWLTQREGQPADERAYLAALRRRANPE